MEGKALEEKVREEKDVLGRKYTEFHTGEREETASRHWDLDRSQDPACQKHTKVMPPSI